MIKVAQICIDKYDGDIPDNIDDLVSLPGIGPKMGYLALQCAWKKNEGIGIDTHVHRICQRLNWTHKPKNPEDTRKQLESWLPKDRWREVNKMLVGFGQQICPARNPKCSECLNDEICPKNFSNEKKSPAKRVKITKKKEIKTEIKAEPQDGALEPLTGNEQVTSGGAPEVRTPEIKKEYDADEEVPAKISKVSGPSKMTTRRQKKEP